jgi:hypothetical protein
MSQLKPQDAINDASSINQANAIVNESRDNFPNWFYLLESYLACSLLDNSNTDIVKSNSLYTSI